MWELILVLALVIIVIAICYSFVGRRFLPSLLLGLIAGMVTLIVLQPTGKIQLSSALEISSKIVLYLMGILSLGISTYLALVFPNRTQAIIQTLPASS